MTVTFTGHSMIFGQDLIKEAVKDEVRRIAATSDNVTCYLGGRGDFDSLCAKACMELKKECSSIVTIYVAPYLSISEQARIRDSINSGMYDTSLYPFDGRVPPRLAIIKRNEWLVLHSDIIIAYVKHGSGGAGKTLSFAKKKNKKIINISDALK